MVVALGLVNGRMKDFYDLWSVPQTQPLTPDALDAAIAATFERRGTAVPIECPVGLSATMALDAQAQRRCLAYVTSLVLAKPYFSNTLDTIWTMLRPSCERLEKLARSKIIKAMEIEVGFIAGMTHEQRQRLLGDRPTSEEITKDKWDD